MSREQLRGDVSGFSHFGIAAVFGAKTVIFNGKRVYGLIALPRRF